MKGESIIGWIFWGIILILLILIPQPSVVGIICWLLIPIILKITTKDFAHNGGFVQ